MLLVALVLPGTARAQTGDVLIQAGHQGRPASCAPNHVVHCYLGAAGGGFRERDWTPVVADEATRRLRADGYRVLRRPADYPEHDTARIALFLHFDGSAPACASGASVGFPPTTSRAFVAAWERFYRPLFPFRFVGENFTGHESGYYGFRKVDAPQKLLIEFGELSCPAQRAWMYPRLRWLGDQVAAFVESELPR
ncbi:MAG TPA: hypothetical protein VMD91_17210 [Candidatus Sulfotelmatobacter sp.]|nr:hypothetical protein [Candidatus Sulfotelmatobacter sp.]